MRSTRESHSIEKPTGITLSPRRQMLPASLIETISLLLADPPKASQ